MERPINALGDLQPDGVSLILGTGISQFVSPYGVAGLAKITGKRVDILAVQAAVPGTGQFRRFIHECKKEFDFIGIWAIFNPVLISILCGYGFRPYEDVFISGEIVEGMVWEKTQ